MDELDHIQHQVRMVRTARAAPKHVYPTMWDKSLSPFVQMENNMDERPYAIQALGNMVIINTTATLDLNESHVGTVCRQTDRCHMAQMLLHKAVFLQDTSNRKTRP